MLGCLKIEQQDYVGALHLLEANAEPLTRELDDGWARFVTATSLGIAYMTTGRHDLADKWFRKRHEADLEIGGGNHPYAAFDYFWIAQNLMMARRFAEARATLASAPTFEPLRGETEGNPDRYARYLIWESARLDIETGQGAAALETLRRGALGEKEMLADRITYATLVGEALCTSGRPREGLPILRQRITLEEEHKDAIEEPEIGGAPEIARVRAVAGLCSLDIGDSKAADVFATESEQAFSGMLGVAPYYSTPLGVLRARLAEQFRRG